MSNSTETRDALIARLCSELTPDRAYYALGTLLGAEDFKDEQLYHRGRLARALAYLFGAGTVAGLRASFARMPVVDPANPNDGDEITVAPGLAIDPFGRLIEVPRRACIRLDRWLRAQDPALLPAATRGSVVTTWLFVRFRTCEKGRTPVIADGPFDATNATAPSRTADGYELRLFLDGAPDEPAFARATVGESTTPIAATRDLLAGETDSGARLAALKNEILDAWGAPKEQLDDAGWVLLARVDVPITQSGDVYRYAPAASSDGGVFVDNHLRPFVYGAWALAREADLPLLAKTVTAP